MATHIVVNPDLDTYNTLEKAFLDVGAEPASPVTYTVFVPGAAPKGTTVPMNARNFATSPDLFGLANKKTALIVATTADPAPSAAVLHQKDKAGNRSAASVPPATKMQGTSFNIPISDTTGGATLFLGNANGTDASAVVQVGGSTAPASAPIRVPGFGVATFKIAQGESNLVVTSTNRVPVVAFVGIGTRLLAVHPTGA
jgi:hypothetical protein